MPEPREPNPRWDLHRTANPAEWGFSVVIPTTNIQENLAAYRAQVPETPFNQLPNPPDPDLASDDQFGLWTLTDTSDNDAGSKRYWYARNYTEEERNTPFRAFWKKFGNHRFDPELEALVFLQDASFPLSANVIRNGQQGIVTSPRPFVRELFRAEVNEGSRFYLEQFVSNVPFAIGRYPVPQAQPVSYDINGVRGNTGPVLHDDIEIPSTLTANATFFGGTAGAESSRLPGQFFPRTNFKRRRPYVLIMEQDLVNGVWTAERIRVFPPKRSRITVS
jgi:hypothetical protein